MPATEVVRDQTRAPLPDVDPNVVLPPAAQAAVDRANAFYQQPDPNATPPAPAPADGDPPAPPAAAAPAETPVAGDPPAPPPAAPPVVGDETSGFDASVGAEGYYTRFRSMQGRFKKSQDQIATLQDQISQIGDELVRTQQMIQHAPPAAGAVAPPAPTKSLITPEDEQNFGTEIIDLTKRAAREAVSGDLEALRNDNANLRDRLQRGTAVTMSQVLDRDVPQWRALNRDPKFKNWLRLRDIYSGGVRQVLLNTAYQAADAPRVVAFFKGFLQEEAATGNVEDPLIEPPASPPVPRTPAVALETLTAPGRARPASGDTPTSPADKPIFTRAQIKKFYDDVRSGVFRGNDAEKNKLEIAIFSAQREGRVR